MGISATPRRKRNIRTPAGRLAEAGESTNRDARRWSHLLRRCVTRDGARVTALTVALATEKLATALSRIDFDDELRARLGANLDEHERRRLPLDGRRHAAVAVVVVDSDAVRDDVEPVPEGAVDMATVPGGPTGEDGRTFDGRMV